MYLAFTVNYGNNGNGGKQILSATVPNDKTLEVGTTLYTNLQFEDNTPISAEGKKQNTLWQIATYTGSIQNLLNDDNKLIISTQNQGGGHEINGIAYTVENYPIPSEPGESGETPSGPSGDGDQQGTNERLYIAIIQGDPTNLTLPQEPGFSTNYGYYFVQNNEGNYSLTEWSNNGPVFSNNAGSYVNVSAFNNATKAETTNDNGGRVTGIFAEDGIDLTTYFSTTISEADIISAYLSKQGIAGNAEDYKLVPYVLKYEDYSSDGYDEYYTPAHGYHLDCYIIKKNNVKVTYNANLNGATTGYTLPADISVARGAQISVSKWTKDSAKVEDSAVTATKGNTTYEFKGWSTTPSEPADASGLYAAGRELPVTTDTTLYAICKEKEEEQTTPSTDTVDAKYFVLMPSMGTPTSGKDQGPKNYFPNNSDNGGVVDCDAGSGYEGKISASVITEHAKADTKTGYFVAAGVESKYLSVPSDLGYFNSNPAYTWAFPDTLGTGFTMQGKQIVWYVIKNEGTKNEPDYHVDGYLAGIPVELRYHENFNFSGTDNNADLVKTVNKKGDNNLLSGDTVTIEGSTIITNQHPGWTFAGWTENRDGSGTGYKATDPKVMMDSCELYAKWEKTYTVNFIGNGGVWDSSVSGYTMTTEDGKNIKATKPITVTPMTESTATVSKIATDPTKADQDFLGWSKTIGGPIITENEWATMNPGETTTIDFYANWKTKQDPTPDTVNYTINKHFKDNKGKTKDVNGTPTPGTKNVRLDSLITNDAVNQTDENGNNYVYVSGETTFKMNGQTVNRDTQLTREATIDLYYYLDNWKDGSSVEEDNEKGGDGIPDCYQVLVKYQSGDTNRGSVGPLTMEVLTIKSNGVYASEGQVTATGSTAEATGRNYFSNWTNKDNTQVGSKATLEAQTIKNAKGGDVYTFTANFDRSSGGGSGGSNRPKPPVVEIPDDVPTGLNGKDHYAYIIGYGNNDVRPQNNITRAEVATIFFRLLTDETREANMTKSNGYNDVKDGDWFCCAVSTLSKMGIIKGYEDGSFKPNDPISRAEFAAIAARFDPDGDKTPASFADVTSHWAKDEISIAANHGWIKGYEDGSFKPDQKITRAETMTLVNRVLNRLPETKDDLHKDMKTWVDNMDETAWYYLAVQEATNSHYFKNKTGTKFEQWTDLRDTRDWSELEK